MLYTFEQAKHFFNSSFETKERIFSVFFSFLSFFIEWIYFPQWKSHCPLRIIGSQKIVKKSYNTKSVVGINIYQYKTDTHISKRLAPNILKQDLHNLQDCKVGFFKVKVVKV